MPSIFYFPASGWKRLFKMYYNVDISEAFINCADNQLTPLFENESGIEISLLAHLSWSPEDVFQYDRNSISRLSGGILLKYGKKPVTIVWKSHSGRIYELSDTDIDCADITFWFEGIDREAFRQLVHPKWSLITFKESYVASFKRVFNLDISMEFVKCADLQLSALFEKQAGLKINKMIGMVHTPNDVLKYERGSVSQFEQNLYTDHFANPVTVRWKSKSGRIYELNDADIDCADIEFWLEGLDVVQVHKLLFPKASLPFKLKDLGFDLVVTRLNLNCTLEMELKEEFLDYKPIRQQIDSFIEGFNETSMKKDRLHGVVHNWSTTMDGTKLVYEMDLGSTGAHFFKKLLSFLSQLNCFIKVEVC